MSGPTYHEGRPVVRAYGKDRFAVLCPYGHVISTSHFPGGTFAGSWLEAKWGDPDWVVRCEGALPGGAK
jgi:hypothetical protein